MIGAPASERGVPGAPERRTVLILLGMMALHLAVFAGLSILKYRYYLYADIDFAIFVQATDRLLAGSFDNSIRGMNWLADHSSLILFPLAPLYAVFRHPITLLVVQSAALSLGAIPVFFLARRALSSEAQALACAALYLAYPAAGYSALFEFHPEVLATPALLAAFYFVWSDRLRPALLFAGLALLAKEDVALVVLMLGLYGAWRHSGSRLRYAAGFAGIAAVSLVITFVMLKPLGAGEVDYWQMYAHWGSNPAESLLGMIRDPLRAVGSFFATAGDAFDSAIKRELWLHLLGPLAFLPLASPVTMLIAFPILAEHLLSQRVHQHTIVFQYTALMTPFMVMAAILGIRNIARRLGGTDQAKVRKASWALLAMALVFSLAANVAFGPVIGRSASQTIDPSQRVTPNGYDRAMKPHRDAMIAQVPNEAGVVAGFEFLARVAGRDNVHSLHSILHGFYTYSTKPYPIPNGIGAVVADLSDERLMPYVNTRTGERWRELLASNQLRPVQAAGDLVLFLRDAPASAEMLSVGAAEPLPDTSIVYDDRIAFTAASIVTSTAAPGATLPIETSWQRLASIDRNYIIEFTLIDRSGNVAHTRSRYLGYTLFPTTDWPAQTTVTESYRLLVPTDLAPGDYTLFMRLLRKNQALTEMAETDHPAVRANRMYVRLGPVRIGTGRISKS